jgi:hypothetical protein
MRWAYLAVDEGEEIEWQVAEAGVDGAGDAPDGGVDGVDAGAERAGVVPGKRVERRDAHRRLRRRRVDELQPPQPRPPLQKQNRTQPEFRTESAQTADQIEPRNQAAQKR